MPLTNPPSGGLSGGTLTIFDPAASGGLTRLVIQQAAGQGGNVFETRTSGGTPVATIDPYGGVTGDYFSTGACYVAYNKLGLGSYIPLVWTSGATGGGAPDAGISRATAGVLNVTDGNTGAGALTTKRSLAVKTSAYTVTVLESFGVFVNTGAPSAVVLTLPAALPGLAFTLIVTAAQSLSFVATGGAAFRNAASGAAGAANGSVASSTVGTIVRVLAVSASEWSCEIVGTATVS